MGFHPNEELAYAIGEIANESNLLVYQRTSRSGDLVPIQTTAAPTVADTYLAVFSPYSWTDRGQTWLEPSRNRTAAYRSKTNMRHNITRSQA